MVLAVRGWGGERWVAISPHKKAARTICTRAPGRHIGADSNERRCAARRFGERGSKEVFGVAWCRVETNGAGNAAERSSLEHDPPGRAKQGHFRPFEAAARAPARGHVARACL